MKPLLVLVAGIFATTLSVNALPKIIAHRGASFDAPENTMSAFKEAWAQGADGIETDVYLTTDGRIVCIHDKTTKRTGGAELSVIKSSYDELSKLDYGSWKNERFKGEKIPLLEEVLDALPKDKFFFVEIKDTPRIVDPIAKLFAEKKPDPARVILISFSDDVVKSCREKLPEYQAYLITSLKDFDKPGKPEEELATLQACGGQGLLFKSTVPVTPEWFKRARGTDRKMFCWNVDEPVLGKKMIELGVDFMGSNKPGFVRAELSK